MHIFANLVTLTNECMSCMFLFMYILGYLTLVSYDDLQLHTFIFLGHGNALLACVCVVYKALHFVL